ncbi:hypothetical protein [Litorivivens sp.]|uniref:hypothetical protein n=1 Tax=Litorivivens sp. TaxID=2020868 RepID=UPI0035692EF8
MGRGIIRDDVTDNAGNAIQGKEVTIYIADTVTKATLYDASTGGSEIGNPVVTDEDGVFEAYADTGEYEVEIDGQIEGRYNAVDGDELADLLAIKNIGGLTTADKVTYDGESANVKLALDARVPAVATLGELPAAASNSGNSRHVFGLGTFGSNGTEWLSDTPVFISALQAIPQSEWANIRSRTNTTDYSAEINALLAAMNATGRAMTLVLPVGDIYANIEIPASGSGIAIIGNGLTKTRLFPATDAPAIKLTPEGDTGITNYQINGCYIGRMTIKGNAAFSGENNQDGIHIATPDQGTGSDSDIVSINNVVLEDLDIRELNGRGIYLHAQPWGDTGIDRVIQTVQMRNVVSQFNVLSGFYCEGHVIECQSLGFRCENNGSALSAAPGATVTNKEKSNFVMKAIHTSATPTSINNYIFPGRMAFIGTVFAEVAKGAHQSLTAYITGGREISFDVIDIENAYRAFELDNYVGPGDVSNTLTVWSVRVNQGNVQGGGGTTLEKFAELNRCRKFSYGQIHIYNDGPSTIGVNITPTTYSNVRRVVDLGANSLGQGTPVVDNRAQTISSGNVEIHQSGRYIILGQTNPDEWEAVSYNLPAYTPTHGDEITISNRSNVSPILGRRAVLAAATRPVHLDRDAYLYKQNDSVTIKYNALTAAWHEVGRNTGHSTLQTTGATPSTVWSLTLPDESAFTVTTEITAKQANSSHRASYRLAALVYRDAGGAATIQGTTQRLIDIESNASWNADIVVSGNDVIVQVTGVAATTIDWTSNTQISSL